MKNLQRHVIREYQDRFNQVPDFVVRAPGRVNLIGGHTDYNEGFVLPMTIDRSIWIALHSREDRCVVVHSVDFPDPARFPLDEITAGKSWDRYVRGVAWALQDEGYLLDGWQGVVASDIPVGAGLASSAALELSLARAFWAVNSWDWDPTEVARITRRTENEWLGLQTGIMDQMISANGKEGHALLIDCRTLVTRLVPLPGETAVVVLDTATQRSLVDSVYNERVAECSTASDFFGVEALRDVRLEDFDARAEELDSLIRRRARHVITENTRTLRAAEAMEDGDAVELGQLMNASHVSLRDDYEVSSRELDAMVEIARSRPGCLGARMTGAGFGGCAVALVRDRSASSFSEEVVAAYRRETGIHPNVYICHPSNGAELVEA